jgi:hypothetical protein
MKRYYCGYCGEEVTEGDLWDDWPRYVYCCGSKECDRELRNMQRAEEENARLDAEEDHFYRYR